MKRSDMDQVYFISTGDMRLNALLDPIEGRGFGFDPSRSLKLLVRGTPGSGKSTFCSQLAIQYVNQPPSPAQGGIAVYYTLDESARVVSRRIRELLKHRSDSVSVIELSASNRINKRSIPAKFYTQGGIVIRRLRPSYDLFPKMYQQSVEEKAGLSPFELAFLVTCERVSFLVDTILSDTSDLHDLYPSAKEDHKLLVIVDSINAMIEFGPSPPRSALRMLFDGLEGKRQDCLVFVGEEAEGASNMEEYLAELVFSLSREERSGSRTLVIEKARDHDVSPIAHPMIIRREGIRVLPKKAAIVKGTEASSSGTKEPRSRFGIDGIDHLLRVDLGDDVLHDCEEGLEIGSSTLVFGPTGSHRLFLAWNFLLEGRKNSQAGVLLILSTDKSTFVRHRANYFFSDQNKIDIFSYQDDLGVIENLEDFILKRTIEHTPKPRRVVIEGLFRKSTSKSIDLFNRLRMYFSHHGITSVVLAGETDKELAMLFDNVINTMYVGRHGYYQSALALGVRKFDGSIREPAFVEYGLESGGKVWSNGESFSELILSGNRLVLAPVSVTYYVGPTNALKALAEFQENRVEDFNQCQFNRFGDVYPTTMGDLALRVLGQPVFVGQNSSEVVFFHHTYLDLLSSRLIDLGARLSDLEKADLRRLPRCARDYFSRDERYGLPYYLDFLVVTYRQDLIETFEAVDPSLERFVDRKKKLIVADADLTWFNLFRLADDLAKESKRFVAFSYVNNSEEDYEALACMILADPINRTRSSSGGLEGVKRSLRNWLSSAFSNRAAGENVLREVGVDAAISVQWVSQILAEQNVAKRMPTSRQVLLSPTLGTPVLRCVVGGVLDGSQSINRSIMILRQMSSPEVLRQMARKGAALPPDERLWPKPVGDESGTLDPRRVAKLAIDPLKAMRGAKNLTRFGLFLNDNLAPLDAHYSRYGLEAKKINVQKTFLSEEVENLVSHFL